MRRLVYLKGYDLLLQALVQLRTRRDVRLVLVANGPERGELRGARLATRHGRRRHVRAAAEQPLTAHRSSRCARAGCAY